MGLAHRHSWITSSPTGQNPGWDYTVRDHQQHTGIEINGRRPPENESDYVQNGSYLLPDGRRVDAVILVPWDHPGYAAARRDYGDAYDALVDEIVGKFNSLPYEERRQHFERHREAQKQLEKLQHVTGISLDEQSKRQAELRTQLLDYRVRTDHTRYRLTR